jgi:hypothetical protein
MQDNLTYKTCIKCQEVKPLSDFRLRYDKRTPMHKGTCRVCENAYERKRIRQRAEENPDLAKARNRQRNQRGREKMKQHPARYAQRKMQLLNYYREKEYNLTLEGYLALHEQQGGVCAICHKPETAKNQLGEVRSLVLFVEILFAVRTITFRVTSSCKMHNGHTLTHIFS